jgi:hypothetical protein
LQDPTGGRRNHLVMGRKPAPIVIHRLSLAEQRVLNSFISGRLPAGQVHDELQRARMAPAPAIEPQPTPAPQPVVALA